MVDKRKVTDMKNKILLVEDNKDIQNFNKKMFEEEGFYVATALTLQEAKEKLEQETPNIIILDIGMPDGSGLDFLHNLRKTSEIPVLMLTGFVGKDYEVNSFKRGCDDFLAKPYDFEILLMRVHRLLKHTQQVPETVEKGNLTLNNLSLTAFVNDVDLLLSPREFALLQMFVQNEGRQLTQTEIFEKVWGGEVLEDKRTLINSISRMRKKLVKSGFTVNTVYNKGYIFEKN